MDHLWRDLMRLIDRASPQQWAVVFVVVIVAGFCLLRGFGSRSKY